MLRAFLITILASAPAFAQSAPARGPAIEKGVVEAGVVGGTTLPVSWLRAHADRHVTLASLEVGRVLSGGVGPGALAGNFEMLLDATPFVLVQQPASTFGMSASPLHLRWNFQPLNSSGARLFAEASGAVLFTGQQVPPRTTRFNFLDQAGFGVRLPAGATRMWLVGYRFQHISNGGRVKPNPGSNFNLIYVGFSVLP